MYSIVTIVNLVLYTWKLPRVDLKHSDHQTKTNKQTKKVRQEWTQCQLWPWQTMLVVAFLPIYFYGHTLNIWKIPRQGLNLSCSYNLCHSCGNTDPLTHCTGLGTEPAWWRFRFLIHRAISAARLQALGKWTMGFIFFASCMAEVDPTPSRLIPPICNPAEMKANCQLRSQMP